MVSSQGLLRIYWDYPVEESADTEMAMALSFIAQQWKST